MTAHTWLVGTTQIIKFKKKYILRPLIKLYHPASPVSWSGSLKCVCLHWAQLREITAMAEAAGDRYSSIDWNSVIWCLMKRIKSILTGLVATKSTFSPLSYLYLLYILYNCMLGLLEGPSVFQSSLQQLVQSQVTSACPVLFSNFDTSTISLFHHRVIIMYTEL